MVYTIYIYITFVAMSSGEAHATICRTGLFLTNCSPFEEQGMVVESERVVALL